MQWATCLMNLEVGKMELVTPDNVPDGDDPKYGEDVHIVPCFAEDEGREWEHSFGLHEFTKECACHPKLKKLEGGRLLIIHTERVN